MYNFLFIYIKISKHSSAKYNQENKGRIQNISKEKKEKKQQYGRERCKNLSEYERQKPVKYRKKYYRIRKKSLVIIITKYYFKK